MSAAAPEKPAGPDQSDRLLLIAAGVVAAIGLTWLVLSAPWSSGSPAAPSPTSVTTSDAPAAAGSSAEPQAAPNPVAPAPAAATTSTESTRLDDPLRLAQLAYEAGMLVEPEDYSAWTLFAAVLADHPDSAEARAGLEAVSDELLRRANVALEQGRFDDAAAAANRILGVLPDYAQAVTLATEIERIKPKPAPEPEPIVEPVAPTVPPAVERERRATVAAPRVAPAPVPIDPLIALEESFSLAMRENRLLTPAGNSAQHYVSAMRETDPDDTRTRAAQTLLGDELIARSAQALEALDPDAARSWIDAAETIGFDAGRIVAARERLELKLIEIESTKRLPVSSFEVVEYVPPEYPTRALERRQEGWVDVEFTVNTDGSVGDVVVADASHDRFFRHEATAAVSQWRFEPRVYLGRPISQRSYARIRFTLSR